MSNVVIVGLDHIGASLGLALQRAVPEWSIWGADLDRRRRQQAKKAGVDGELARNLRHAVDIADIIIINSDLTMRETIFQNQGKDIKEDAVVIDLTTLKQRGLDLARQYSPERSYIGAQIVVNPHTMKDDIASASHALFTNALFCIVMSKDTDGRSLKCAESLAGYIGANPLFFSTEEFDGLRHGPAMMSVFAAASQFKTLRNSPGWTDVSRVAGPEIVQATTSIDQEDLTDLVFANKDATIYWLDQVIAELMAFKKMISNGDREEIGTDLNQLREDWTILSRNLIDGIWNNKDDSPDRQGVRFGKLMFGRFWRKDERHDG